METIEIKVVFFKKGLNTSEIAKENFSKLGARSEDVNHKSGKAVEIMKEKNYEREV